MPLPQKCWNNKLSPEEIQELPAPRLQQLDPNRYSAVVMALKEGLSLKKTSKLFGISAQTVSDIISGNPQELGEWKERQTNDFKRIVNLATSRLTDEIEDIAPEKLPVLLGILTDKISTLQGDPTSIVKHTSSRVDTNKLLEELEEAEVIDVKDFTEKQGKEEK